MMLFSQIKWKMIKVLKYFCEVEKIKLKKKILFLWKGEKQDTK